MMSVTTELPFLNNTPPTAGKRAKARGMDAQFELSSTAGRAPGGLGLKRPPASCMLYSEKVELRRREPSKGSPEAAAAEGDSKRDRRRVVFSSTVADRRRPPAAPVAVAMAGRGALAVAGGWGLAEAAWTSSVMSEIRIGRGEARWASRRTFELVVLPGDWRSRVQKYSGPSTSEGARSENHRPAEATAQARETVR
jgi:hypothetical protein